MASITFYDQDNYRGREYAVKATSDKYEVKEVPKGKSSVASIWVDEGTWLVYTDNNFMGASFLLAPRRGYEDTQQVKKEAQSLNVADEWKDQVRSLRLVTPSSLMLFDNDFFRGSCSVITATTDSIEDSDCQSLIIGLGGAQPHAQQQQVDLVFVLDGSGSIKQNNFEKVKEFASKISADLPISPATTRVGMIQYSNIVSVEFKLAAHTDNASVKTAIQGVKYQNGGYTYTGKALEAVRTQMDWRQPPAKRVVIVVTDGESNDAVDGPAQALRRDGFTVFAVGVGVKPNELVHITQDAGRVFPLNNFDKLQDLIATLAESVKTGEEWTLYEYGRFRGNDWKAYPGYYTGADVRKNLGSEVGSAKRLV
ncbi:PREDICTED: collagen alpha-6(VI) chain-like [Branchiostoma belcheri]|uniref:Collagen alpha-6(VI) chain-like n=1 Tax=Branchiostoma belcheri TaxID=7741 RepID=A0A6P4ZGY5_BRABE|nr:PREDICTED: collagen alpha-6(VI) chain-like [Branchiostoma belcheri]